MIIWGNLKIKNNTNQATFTLTNNGIEIDKPIIAQIGTVDEPVDAFIDTINGIAWQGENGYFQENSNVANTADVVLEKIGGMNISDIFMNTGSTPIVNRAIQAEEDGLGNNIENTYLKQSAVTITKTTGYWKYESDNGQGAGGIGPMSWVTATDNLLVGYEGTAVLGLYVIHWISFVAECAMVDGHSNRIPLSLGSYNRVKWHTIPNVTTPAKYSQGYHSNNIDEPLQVFCAPEVSNDGHAWNNNQSITTCQSSYTPSVSEPRPAWCYFETQGGGSIEGARDRVRIFAFEVYPNDHI